MKTPHRLTVPLVCLLCGLSSSSTAIAAPGDVDLSFQAIIEGNIGQGVESMAVQADGRIIIAGDFTSVAGAPRNRVARLQANGGLDTSFNPNGNGEVTCAAIQADGRIIIGGGFTTVKP